MSEQIISEQTMSEQTMSEQIMSEQILTLEDRVLLIKSIGEEIIGEANLERLLANKPQIIAYDGFEPSSLDKGMHIAQGLLRAHNVNKFVKAGVKFKFWVADWFALMNLKLGGDLKKIQKAGNDMIESWKACGMNTDAVDANGEPMIEFIWSSEEIVKRSDEYWRLVLDIATKFPLNRIKKCTQIMGRKDEENIFDSVIALNNDINSLFDQIETTNSTELDTIITTPIYKERKDHILNTLQKLLETNPQELATSQIFYPIMQCADVFFLGCDITSLGMDQRKVNMLALEYCDKIKRKLKPIIVSHHMLMGLDGSDKMSKSNPDNTIFMNDSENDIGRKIKKAFCEPGNIEKNPLIDWIQYLILPIDGSINIITLNDSILTDSVILRSYTNIEEVKINFANQKIHPKDLKKSVSNSLINMLIPVQQKLKHKTIN